MIASSCAANGLMDAKRSRSRASPYRTIVPSVRGVGISSKISLRSSSPRLVPLWTGLRHTFSGRESSTAAPP